MHCNAIEPVSLLLKSNSGIHLSTTFTVSWDSWTGADINEYTRKSNNSIYIYIWRRFDSTSKSSAYNYMRYRYSQRSHGGSQPSITSSSEHQTPSSGTWGTRKTNGAQTYMQTNAQTYKINFKNWRKEREKKKNLLILKLCPMPPGIALVNCQQSTAQNHLRVSGRDCQGQGSLQICLGVGRGGVLS